MLFLLHARSSQDALPLGLSHFSSFLFFCGITKGTHRLNSEYVPKVIYSKQTTYRKSI